MGDPEWPRQEFWNYKKVFQCWENHIEINLFTIYFHKMRKHCLNLYFKCPYIDGWVFKYWLCMHEACERLCVVLFREQVPLVVDEYKRSMGSSAPAVSWGGGGAVHRLDTICRLSLDKHMNTDSHAHTHTHDLNHNLSITSISALPPKLNQNHRNDFLPH